MSSYVPDLRTCKFCKKQSFVYQGSYYLFKYGVRHYAHASCLAQKFGVKGGEAAIPEHERKDYRWQLSLLKPDGWEMTRAQLVDKGVRR